MIRTLAQPLLRASRPRQGPSSYIRIARREVSSIADPNHPTGLYYHPLPKENQWAVSLLPDTPSSEEADSIMGIVSERVKGKAPATDPAALAAADADNFSANPDFLKLLHTSLKEDIVPNDAFLETEAQNRESGWAHLTDSRHPLMPGRIATPENIIASVAFVDSKLLPDSYQINETYRLLTKEEGWIQLKEEWLSHILKRLKAAN